MCLDAIEKSVKACYQENNYSIEKIIAPVNYNSELLREINSWQNGKKFFVGYVTVNDLNKDKAMSYKPVGYSQYFTLPKQKNYFVHMQNITCPADVLNATLFGVIVTKN